MKKTRKILLTVLSVLTIAAVSLGAASCGSDKESSSSQITDSSSEIMDSMGTEGVLYQASSDDTYAEVIGYEGTATEVKIADTYNGLPVKTIYDRAFYYNDNITSVIIPDSVTSIGEKAFCDCSSLTRVVIPDSVTSIGLYAFSWCSSLTSVEIPDSVTSIGDYAFYKCSSLTSVVIGDSVTSIGEYAFAYCSSLTSVVIGDSVTSIGQSAFYDCSSLTSVYYKGTASEWDAISIDWWGNSYLTDVTRYYYSETEPTEEGNYWHYVDGVPTVW